MGIDNTLGAKLISHLVKHGVSGRTRAMKKIRCGGSAFHKSPKQTAIKGTLFIE